MSRCDYISKRLTVALGVLAFFGVTTVHAATVGLFVNITQPLLDGDGNALADGSVIYVIASIDSTADGMSSWGDSLIANSTQGDDVIIATLILDSSTTGVPGTMTAFIPDAFDNSVYNFLYLRFFDYQGSPPPVGDDIAWGETPPQGYTNFFGTAIMNVPGDQVHATNNFIIIPEPGTLPLVLVAGLLLALFCARRDPKKLATARLG